MNNKALALIIAIMFLGAIAIASIDAQRPLMALFGHSTQSEKSKNLSSDSTIAVHRR